MHDCNKLIKGNQTRNPDKLIICHKTSFTCKSQLIDIPLAFFSIKKNSEKNCTCTFCDVVLCFEIGSSDDQIW